MLKRNHLPCGHFWQLCSEAGWSPLNHDVVEVGMRGAGLEMAWSSPCWPLLELGHEGCVLLEYLQAWGHHGLSGHPMFAHPHSKNKNKGFLVKTEWAEPVTPPRGTGLDLGVTPCLCWSFPPRGLAGKDPPGPQTSCGGEGCEEIKPQASRALTEAGWERGRPRGAARAGGIRSGPSSSCRSAPAEGRAAARSLALGLPRGSDREPSYLRALSKKSLKPQLGTFWNRFLSPPEEAQ